eukprot:16011318-Heterocapsa_arctica.AAC.1
MIKEEVNYDGHELTYVVDAMVLLTKEAEEQTIIGLHTDLTAAKQKLTNIGQVLNDGEEQIFVQHKSSNTIWNKLNRDCKGRFGQAVLDLGITLRTHTQASPNKGKRVTDTAKVVKRAQALALSVRDK